VAVSPQTKQPDAIIIGSPAATLTPVALTEGDIMTQAVALELLKKLSSKVTELYDLPHRWLPLRDGLRLWLLWDQELPLAIWHQPVVRWVFLQPMNAVAPEASSFSEFAYALCANHSLWMVSPIEAGIPLLCLPPTKKGERILSWRLPSSLPPLTSDLSYSHDHDRAASSAESVTKIVALATVVEYAVTTFGSDRLPILLATLPAHESWETLIPAVYGISLEDFQNGWHTFLGEHYGIRD
jgi:hypothetical protein